MSEQRIDPSVFETPIDRRGTGSLKWDLAEALLGPEQAAADPLPMWVADMDIKAPQVVLDALHDAVDQGVFGYPMLGEPAYLDAVVGWQKRRFGWDVQPEWVVQTSGVISALKTAVQAFTRPEEKVLIQPPVYSHFHDDVRLNGRDLTFAPLHRTDDGYRFDADVFERAITPDTRLFVMSNPHNPTGNVWTADELRTMGEICAAHDVLVLSDEIHQDLVLSPDARHVPFASLGEEFAQSSITCTAPSKTFNVAGLQCANTFVPNPQLRATFTAQYERNVPPIVNSLGSVACRAAYEQAEPWLEGLLEHLRGNRRHFEESVNSATDKARVLPSESLYLAWIDFRPLDLDPVQLTRFLTTKARLWLDAGEKFGAEGHGYARINLGCPRATVDEAVDRLLGALT